MESGVMVCGWETCGATLQPMPGRKFVKCDKCCHMTCVRCRASHEGVNCAAYQAGRTSSSPRRSLSVEDSSPTVGSFSFSLGAIKDYGGSASPRRLSSPPISSSSSFQETFRSPISAYQPRDSATTSGGTSSGSAPRQPGAAGGAKKRVLCASEDCGYETMVDANATELPCYKCRHTTCLRCNATHGNLTCEQYQQQKLEDEEEIQVHCAKSECPFVAFVGVSMQQMTCTLCKQITCLKCKAIHEFVTCEEYEEKRQRPEEAQAAQESEQDSAGAAQAQPAERSSPDAEPNSTEQPAAAVTVGHAPMDRKASRLQENLVSQAATEVRPQTDVSTSQTGPVFSQPQVTNPAAPQSEAFLVECCSCMSQEPYDAIVEVAPCGHFLCKECVRTSGVSSRTYVVHCPVKSETGDWCQSQILESVLQSALNPQEYGRHAELLPLAVQRCPVEGCSGKFSFRPGMKSIECSLCHTEYCDECSANHPGRTCAQFLESVLGGGAVQLQDEVLQRDTASDAVSTSSLNAAEDCNACFAHFSIEEIANIEGCGHFICRACLGAAMANNRTERVLCPAEEHGTPCQHYIQESARRMVNTDEEAASPNVGVLLSA